MADPFLRVNGRQFEHAGEELLLRGYGLGSWLNLEHFMVGLPGTHSQIFQAVRSAYGEERAAQFWDKFQSVMIDEADISYLKNLGVNTLRLPFNYHLFENDQQPYSYDERGFVQLDRVIDLCREYDILAVLDMHAAPGCQNPDWHSDNALGDSLLWKHADFRRRTLALWKHIARHYAGDPSVGGYDLLNEPVLLGADPSLLADLTTELIDAIRGVDPDHVIFVEGEFYANDFSMFAPFSDPNVACSFHYYPSLNHFATSERTQKERIAETISRNVRLPDLVERLGRPLWCGETGASMRHGERSLQAEMVRDTLEVLEEHDISWSIWTYKDARSMGTLHPRPDSEWMAFSQQACRGWDFWSEFADREQPADELIARSQVDLPFHDKHRLVFHLLANNQLLQKQVTARLFAETSFETAMRMLDSFRFENCETWDEMAEVVKGFTGGG